MDNKKNNKTDFAKEVLERIEKENITPRGRWQFLAKNYFLWTLWGVSVLVGAAAVAATIFVFANAGWQFYSATHDSFFEFIIESLPYLWGAVLGIFIFAAYENVRHTKRGYRYPFYAIIIFSILASLLGGTVLYATGLGHVFDEQVGKRVPFHRSAVFHQKDLWVQPERGLLAGEVLEVEEDEASFTLAVFDGDEWEVDGSDLREKDWEALERFREVRVVGLPVEDEVFHACFVFPWEVVGRRLGAPGPERDKPLMPRGLKPRPPFPRGEMYERKFDDERSSECGSVRFHAKLQALREKTE